MRPTNRALSFALEQLLRISDAGIPVVMIAGNHSTPRLRETGSVFRLFEHLKGVHPVYKGTYERVDIGDMAVHAVPHSDDPSFKGQLALIEVDPKVRFNVAMLHAGVVGFNVFKMNEFNEQLVETSFLKEDLDYIALGHYHDSYQVAKNAFYSGSIERFSFSEAHQKKGYMLVDLETGVRTFKELPTREMLDLGPVDASGMDPTSLMGRIEDLLSRDLDGKICHGS